jgi:hypothetical protein
VTSLWSTAKARTIGGEPFSDAARAAVVSRKGVVAKVLGNGIASCVGLSGDLVGR